MTKKLYDLLFCCSCLEACYWHLIEKRFCYDESIALYEEPKTPYDKFNNNAFDNMAFYDQVSLIAGRAIVTIDSKPKAPIEHQPVRKLRWFENQSDQKNVENVLRSTEKQINKENTVQTPIIIEPVDIPQTKDEVDSKSNLKNEEEEVTVETNLSSNLLQNEVTPSENNHPNEIVKSSTTPNIKSTSLLNVANESERTRKKSLRERRMSRSLTLTIDRNIELPVFRHTSMPKFYLDTPEMNQTDSTFLMTPSATLTSPVLPRNSDSAYFDLRSIVQIENEHRYTHNQTPVPVHHKQFSPHSRLSQIKDKLKSTKLKKSGSSTNLPNSIQHI